MADTLAARFDAKYVIVPNGCWIWTGSRVTSGYGNIHTNDGPKYAHRISYERHKGSIPDGLDLDHLCRDRGCVNPDHLEPVTRRENLLRGHGHTARNAIKTHCVRGHLFDDANTYWYRGCRQCRTCMDIRRGR